MNKISIRNKNYDIPENWNEISKHELLVMGEVFPLIPSFDKLLRLFFGFLKVNKRPLLQLHLFWNKRLADKLAREIGSNLYFENLTFAIDQLDNFAWVFKTNELTKTVIDQFRVGFTVYYGHGAKLNNVEIEEFAFADAFFIKYMQTKEEIHLNRMIACLYRPKGTGNHGDVRKYFFDNEIEARAKRISKVSIAKRHAILLNYIGQRSHLINSPSGKKVFTSNKKSDKGWGHVILSIAGGKFGDYDKTRRAMLWDVLRDLAMQKE